MNIDVATILQKSELALASDAYSAIWAGWRIDVSPNLSSCKGLHRAYKIRHKHLLSLTGEHAKQLEASVGVFVSNLELHSQAHGHWVTVSGNAIHHFAIFVLADLQTAIGCLCLIGKQDVSDADWEHIWRAKA
jgi:hypothetical protein